MSKACLFLSDRVYDICPLKEYGQLHPTCFVTRTRGECPEGCE